MFPLMMRTRPCVRSTAVSESMRSLENMCERYEKGKVVGITPQEKVASGCNSSDWPGEPISHHMRRGDTTQGFLILT